MYTNIEGETSMRSTDYSYTSQKELDNEEEIVMKVKDSLMNIEIIWKDMK